MMPIDTLMWGVTITSLVGVVANIKKKWWCFAIWLFTNSVWMVYDYTIGAYAQSALFAVYVVLAVYGIYEWRVLTFGSISDKEPFKREDE